METVAVANTEKLYQGVQPLIEKASSVSVLNNDELEIVHGYRKELKLYIKKVEEFFKPEKEAADKLHSMLCKKEQSFLNPAKTANKILEQKEGDYLDKLEAERKAEEARLAELAAKDRDKRLAAIDKKIETLMGKEGDLREKLQILTLALDASETEEEAQAIRTQINVLNAKLQTTTERIQVQEQKVETVIMPEIISVDNKPKVDGMSDRKDPMPEVVDPMALVHAIADKLVPLSVIDWNIGNIKKLIKAGVYIPGVKVEWRRNISVRV